jgi:diguanylate cyclase (GGDEF)-like protein/PAS domain S-box-containing protein
MLSCIDAPPPLKQGETFLTETPLALLHDDEFYREAFAQAGVGMAMVACDGRFLNVNRAFCRLTRYTREELLSKTFQSITHPDDLRADLANAEALLLGEIDSYTMEKRYLRGDGEVIWVELNAGVVRDAAGEPVYGLAQVSDISARKAAEAARDQALFQTQAVLEASTHVSIIATDLQGVIRIFNAGAERMLGYSAEEMVGKCTPAIFHLESEVSSRGGELSRRFGRRIEGFDVFVEYARHGTHEEREWTYVRRDGGHLTVNLVVTAQRDSQGDVTGFLGIATDITRRKQTEAELRYMSEHLTALAAVDPLTSIDNRRSSLTKLEHLWAALKSDDHLAVLMLDIDHFKQVNDRYGHVVGDEVLKRVAQVVRKSLRSSDTCGRLGGEEFLIVCPRASPLTASRIAERIRQSVEWEEISAPTGERVRVSVSVGVAERVAGMNHASDLIACADQRLYQAKLLGRNRVVNDG